MAALRIEPEDWRPALQAGALAGEPGRAPERPDGVVTRLFSKSLGPVSAVVCEVAFDGPFHFDYTHPRDRVMIALDEVGDRVHAHDSPSRPRRGSDLAHRMYVAPAHSPYWTFSETPLFLRYLTLEYDQAGLETFAESARPLSSSPRFAFFEPRLLALARQIEIECQTSGPSDPMRGDDLALQLVGRLGGDRSGPPGRFHGGLTARQARLVTDYLESHFMDAVDTGGLARLAGLSPSHFHRAFRISMGRPPHVWLTERRLQHARELMLRTAKPLAQIALEAGFADQPHFTRTFSRLTGVSPAAWRRTTA